MFSVLREAYSGIRLYYGRNGGGGGEINNSNEHCISEVFGRLINSI